MPGSSKAPANIEDGDPNALAEQLAGIGHWRWDLAGGQDYWSAGALHIQGLTSGGKQPAFEKVTERLHPDDRERVVETVNDAISAGLEFKTRSRIYRADSAIRQIEITGLPEFDASGTVIALFGAIKDITEWVEVESSLKESEERLRDFIASSSDLVWEIDEQGIFRRLEGRSFRPQIRLEDFIGKTHRDIPNVIGGPAFWDKFDRLFEKQEPFRGFLFSVERDDGSPVHIELGAVPRFDANGDFRGFRGTSQDVTERVEFERGLQEGEKRFHDLALASSDGFWEIDPHGYFTRIDGPGFRSGINPRNYIGLRRQEIPGVLADPSVWERYEELLASRKPFRDFRFTIESETGELVHIQLNAIPRFGEDGQFLGYRGTSQNITDRVHSERRLQLLQRAVEETQDGILITGNVENDFAILYVNSAFQQITGYTPEDAIGENCRFLHRNDPDQSALEDLREALTKQVPVRVQLRNFRKDGSEFYQELSVSPVHDDKGNVSHFVGVQHDITDRVLTEERLKEAQKLEALGRMTGGLAHDFNNILSIIRLNLELAQDTGGQDMPAAKNIDRALSAVGRATRTTASLLAFARRQPLAPRLVDVAAVLDNLRDPLALTLGRQIELKLGLGSRKCVMVDPQQFENAIINIAINSRDAMDNGGRLTIESRDLELSARSSEHPNVPPGEYVLLTIVDTGTGIPGDILDQIFEPFFSTKKDQRGSGLGLSMVHGFVRQSGGHIHVTSSDGEGATVFLYLPAAEGTITAEDREDPRPVDAYRGRNRSVLLVEDEDGVRSATAAMLVNDGFRVIEAANRDDAITVLDRIGRPDLVVTDIVLASSADGLDLAAQLRERWPELPIILVSGYSERLERGEFEIDKYSAFLQKPFGRRELAGALHSLLQN